MQPFDAVVTLNGGSVQIGRGDEAGRVAAQDSFMDLTRP
jgi:hypothetical protein